MQFDFVLQLLVAYLLQLRLELMVADFPYFHLELAYLQVNRLEFRPSFRLAPGIRAATRA